MNNKIIAALVSIALIASPALACVGNDCWYGRPDSDIRTSLIADGETSVIEQATVFGDYQGKPTATAYVLQNVNNDGFLMFNSQATSYGDWDMQEDSSVYAEGKTDIEKEVVWWTVDPTTRCGELKYPTVANIYTEFATDSMVVVKEVHNTANVPPAGVPNVFAQSLTSKVPMTYGESVGINKPTRCSIADVVPPVEPVCTLCVVA